MFRHTFHHQYPWFDRQIKQIKMAIAVIIRIRVNKQLTSEKLIYFINVASLTKYFVNFSGLLFGLNFFWNSIYIHGSSRIAWGQHPLCFIATTLRGRHFIHALKGVSAGGEQTFKWKKNAQILRIPTKHVSPFLSYCHSYGENF